MIFLSGVSGILSVHMLIKLADIIVKRSKFSGRTNIITASKTQVVWLVGMLFIIICVTQKRKFLNPFIRFF